MRRWSAAIVLILLPSAIATACLWDTDTAAEEAKDLPEVVAVITGRFPRNPPLYYEMRLKRVAEQLRTHPDDLGACDDAGVACDRLGRDDEAIVWMERKRDALDRLGSSHPEAREHEYRYHANLGTFLVHRWARAGADRARIEEVRAARDEIARALEINPDAHFGREVYQLRALDWILDPPAFDPRAPLPNLLGWDPTPGAESRNGSEVADPADADAAVRGLAGLIVLGNAWESVDVYYALQVALANDSLGFPRNEFGGRNSLAALAWLRCTELIRAGRGSLVPGAPEGESLKRSIPHPAYVEAHTEPLASSYPRLRAEADTWQAARTAFMLDRLRAGRHPDTDPTFWTGYVEPPAPSLPTMTHLGQMSATRARQARSAGFALLIGLVLLGSSAVALVLVRRRSRRRKPAPLPSL